MSIQLPVVRYYTPADPYNYTVDNRPIYDLANGMSVLKSAVETLSSSGSGFSRSTSAGAWPMNFNIDLNAKRGSNWCVKATIWAVENSTTLANYSIIDVVLTGTNTNLGIVTLVNSTTIDTVKVGNGDVAITYNTSQIDKVQVNLTGYLSSFGFVSCAYTLI